MIFPHYFFISLIVYGFIHEFREWIELILDYHDNHTNENSEEKEEIPESVKHMYS